MKRANDERNPEPPPPKINVYFSDFFGMNSATLREYGPFDISLVSDLPLFIDPFLLSSGLDPALVRSWYTFKEVNQLWFGYTMAGNSGTGLGPDFAQTLHSSLGDIFANFGSENLTKGSHLEKVCLIRPGVGKDHISDFTARHSTCVERGLRTSRPP